jgi:outer membrane protein
LTPPTTVDRLSPNGLAEATEVARHQHPAVLAAGFDVDVAQTTIKVAEGTLLPTLTVQASTSRSVQSDPTLGASVTDQASIIGQLNAPIYDGGTAASQTRQAKEVAAQSRIVLQQIRNQSQTAVAAAWVTNEGTKVTLTAVAAEIRAAETALQGIRRETLAGQRTTLDFLNAQQELTLARSRQILAQRDRVISSYTLLSAIGRLDVKTLGLKTPDYMPELHYHQVRDAWHGVRTPSGK